jgi:DNA-binding NarL/FixJ family response regulator
MRVLIADDHPLLVDGLCSLLEAHGIEVVATVGDGKAAVSQALRWDPDLVLMDIRMPVCDGLLATRLIKAERPDMNIVILTTSAEDEDLFEAIKSGACGYLLKSTGGPAFIEALHGLEQGVPPFSPGLAGRLLREFARQAGGDKETGRGGDAESPDMPASPGPPVAAASASTLSQRQIDVLRLVSAGLTYKGVGARLALSEETVRYHMREIMRVLHLENRAQAIAYAGEHGLK